MITQSALKSFGFAFLSLSSLSVISSCTTTVEKEAAGPPRDPGYWKGDGVTGSPRILISLSEQKAKYFKGDQLVGESPISSGREGYSTRPGSFKIIEKDFDHRSSLYGAFVDANGNIVQEDVSSRKDTPPPGTRFVGAEMPGFMRITGAVGMHAGYLPGYPASHGCIRLPAHMARIFYNETPHGTPVRIVGDASEAPMLPPVIAAVEPPEEKPKKKTKKKAEKTEEVAALGMTRYLTFTPRANEQAEEKADEIVETKSGVKTETKAVASVKEGTKATEKPKAASRSRLFLGGTKKPKAAPVPRGQTLYLRE